MDWKLFTPTQPRIDDEGLSRKNRVSLDRLFYNLDALLKRDMDDCFSKQLNGQVHNNAKIYQARPRVQRKEQIDYYDDEEDVGKASKRTAVQGRYSRHLALNFPNTSIRKSLHLQSKSNHSQYGKSSTALSPKKSATPPQISPTPPRSRNSDRKGQLKFERLPLTLEANKRDLLPSNGWWKTETSSDSDSDREDEIISETDNDSSDSQASLFRSNVSGYNTGESKAQTSESSSTSPLSQIQGMQFEEMRGARDTSSIFHLTSRSGDESDGLLMDETDLVPRPPQPTPDPNDKTCQTSSENTSLSCFSRSTNLTSNAAVFDDDMQLDYKELFHHRCNATSRINSDNLETFKHNYSRPDKEATIRTEDNSSQRCFEDKSRKLKCIFPKVNTSKEKTKKNKAIIPVVLHKRAVNRRPNTSDVPVTLRLKHRTSAFTKFSKVVEENSSDERVLPTTLNRSAEASYSVMTPYMANIVWSVMDDEKVV